MVMDFVMEKQRFWDVFCPQTVKKSDFSYEKGMKTYDFQTHTKGISLKSLNVMYWLLLVLS